MKSSIPYHFGHEKEKKVMLFDIHMFLKNYAYEKPTISDRKHHFFTRLKIYEILGGKFEPRDILLRTS